MSRLAVVCGVVAALALVVVLASAGPQAFFVLYTQPTCPHCHHALTVLGERYDERFIVNRDITVNETYLEEFLELWGLVAPEDIPGTPLIIIFVGGKPAAVCLGDCTSALEDVLSVALQAADEDKVVVVGPEGAKFYNETMGEKILGIVGKLPVSFNNSENASGGGAEEERWSFEKAFPLILSLALADSVNPCTFSVFTAMLLIAASVRGVRKAFFSGLAFILAVFSAYYLLGLGILKVFLNIPFIEYIIAALGIYLGLTALIGGLSGRFKSPIPSKLKKITENAIEKAVNPLTAGLAGFIVSFTLLPCSSGPYLVAGTLLAKLNDIRAAYLLLAIYNMIFVAPLLAILIGVSAFSLKLRSVKRWRSRYLPRLEAVSGLLLLLISLYVLVQAILGY